MEDKFDCNESHQDIGISEPVNSPEQAEAEVLKLVKAMGDSIPS